MFRRVSHRLERRRQTKKKKKSETKQQQQQQQAASADSSSATTSSPTSQNLFVDRDPNLEGDGLRLAPDPEDFVTVHLSSGWDLDADNAPKSSCSAISTRSLFSHQPRSNPNDVPDSPRSLPDLDVAPIACNFPIQSYARSASSSRGFHAANKEPSISILPNYSSSSSECSSTEQAYVEEEYKALNDRGRVSLEESARRHIEMQQLYAIQKQMEVLRTAEAGRGSFRRSMERHRSAPHFTGTMMEEPSNLMRHLKTVRSQSQVVSDQPLPRMALAERMAKETDDLPSRPPATASGNSSTNRMASRPPRRATKKLAKSGMYVW